MTPLIRLENIVRTYPDPGSPHAVRTVLDLSSLDIRAGEILGIRGHNGSGKSTLLRIVALLEPPDAGTILFEGKPAGTDDLHLRRQVTLLLQTPYLLSRSVASNVAYGLRVRGIRDAAELAKRTEAALLAVASIPPSFRTGGATSCPAENASAWPSPPVWPCGPACCSWTSPPPAWTSRAQSASPSPPATPPTPVPPWSSSRTIRSGSPPSPTVSSPCVKAT